MNFFDDLNNKTILNKTKNENNTVKKTRTKKDENKKVKIVSFSLQNEVIEALNKLYNNMKQEDDTITKSKVLNNILKDYFKSIETM